MAGGKYAEIIVCPTCQFDYAELLPAKRINEGLEVDQYECEKGHVHAISWDGEELPLSPLWPATQKDKDIIKIVRQALDEGCNRNEVLQKLVHEKLF